MAEKAGQVAGIIVRELHLPEEEKTIKPVDIGGVAGGRKFLHDGLLLKIADDEASLYGGDIEKAQKVCVHVLNFGIALCCCLGPAMDICLRMCVCAPWSVPSSISLLLCMCMCIVCVCLCRMCMCIFACFFGMCICIFCVWWCRVFVPHLSMYAFVCVFVSALG